jgi:hypothetical protein
MEIDVSSPRIEWTIVHGHEPSENTASATWRDFTIEVSHNPDGAGWNVRLNGEQAWTYMRSFDETLYSVKSRLLEWAYINQFLTLERKR